MRTDFEECGLAGGPVVPGERTLWVTVDFEAFYPDARQLWNDAMRIWAHRAAFPSTFFVATENVVQLRENEPRLYDDFLEAAGALGAAGVGFHPHNHYVYDRNTGARLDANGATPPGYRKRESVFSHVVHRHGRDFGDWTAEVMDDWRVFLADAQLTERGRAAYRAGGWDYGSGRDDLQRYLRGLAHAGVAIDSSACRGTFGAPDWRVGAPFARNTFRLEEGIEEIAPSRSLDIGAITPRAVAELGRERALWSRRHGTYVLVLHFDHLFHAPGAPFAVNDVDTVERRIARLARVVRGFARAFGLRLTAPA